MQIDVPDAIKQKLGQRSISALTFNDLAEIVGDSLRTALAAQAKKFEARIRALENQVLFLRSQERYQRTQMRIRAAEADDGDD